MIVVILLVVLAQFIACPFDDVTLAIDFICESYVLTYIIFKKEDPRQVPRVSNHIIEMLIVLS